MSLIEENSTLITETNALRKELKTELRKNMKMEVLLGLHKKVMTPKESEKKLKEAVATRQEIHKKYKEKILVR